MLKDPTKLRGQIRDQGLELQKGEVVVVKKTFGFRFIGDVFVYSDPAGAGRETDLQLLAPSDGLLARLNIWTVDTEKFFWNASLVPQESLRRATLDMVKTLMDAFAIDGRGAAFNANNEDANVIAPLKELERLGVVIQKGGGGSVSGWVIVEKVANTLEPMTRLYKPSLVCKSSSSSSSDKTVVDLMELLENGGWEARVWNPSDGAPPPVNVRRGRPKLYYMKSTSSTPVLSKHYLQVLLSISTITCCKEVEHLATDAHYKWLLTDGKGKDPRKRTRDVPAIKDDTNALAELMDGEPYPKRGRGRGAGRSSGGRGGRSGRRGGSARGRIKDERTTRWGAALITYSTKENGTLVVQGTCHRTHAHPPLPGKPTTVCRTTYNVNEHHTEEQCTMLVKIWLASAGDYTTRLKHQGKRFCLEDIVEDVDAWQPDSNYNTESDVDVDDGDGGVPPPPIPKWKPKMRLRAKARVDE